MCSGASVLLAVIKKKKKSSATGKDSFSVNTKTGISASDSRSRTHVNRAGRPFTVCAAIKSVVELHNQQLELLALEGMEW